MSLRILYNQTDYWRTSERNAYTSFTYDCVYEQSKVENACKEDTGK
jgi:hypothetical protein